MLPDISEEGRINSFLNRKIEVILAHLFFFFFTAQILSPFIGGITFYIEFFIAICNPFFVLWLIKRPKKIWILIVIGIITIVGLFLQIKMIFKIIFLLVNVLFLFYSEERKVFYLKQYIVLNVLFALAQFVLLFVNPTLARLIGPDNIAKTIWGNYSTLAFTNFYTVFLIPRVSGLSREAGFMASLILVAILLYYLSYKRSGQSKLYVLFLFIGFSLSVSKMSLLIAPLFIIIVFSRYIDKIPIFYMVLIFVSTMVIFWSNQFTFLSDPSNETFVHRFAAYPIIKDLNVSQLLFGEDNLSSVHSRFSKLLLYHNFDFGAGFGGFIISNGILLTFIVFLFFYLIGCSTTGVLLLLLLTMNVDILTSQNFVVLAYYIVFRYFTPYSLKLSNVIH